MQSSQGRAFYVSLLGFGMASAIYGQQPLPQRQDVIRQEASRPLLPSAQLDALVAPLALYPDPLLGQALAASTYPLELVEAQQWLQKHPDLHGSQLVEAAKELNCDESVRVMVAFPDVLRLLTQNVRWTTDLGNAFLAQQSDVMDAIQRLRGRAHQNGYLTDTPQQQVTTQPGPVQDAISIQPADPQVMQAPAYNPERVWGPPAAGEYPSLWYPAVSSGSGFGSPVEIGSVLSGLLSWSGWGWGLNWFTRGLFLNDSFFNTLGNGLGGLGGGASEASSGVTAWAHNPTHRLGVPYSNRTVASRFGGPYRGGLPSTPARQYADRRSTPSEGWRSFGSHPSDNSYRGAGRGMSPANAASMGFRQEARASQAPPSSYRGFSGQNSARSVPRSYASMAPPPQFSRGDRSEPRRPSGGHFSAPKSSGRFKAPKFSSHSSGHSSKGSSGGHGKSSRGKSHRR